MSDSPMSLPPDTDGERRPHRFWTMVEIRKLREIYPVQGIQAAVAALDGRTASAVYGKANNLGLKGPGGGWNAARRMKWPVTPEIDADIVGLYSNTPTSGGVNKLASRLGRPRWWVSKRAARLGLVAPRFKEPNWTQKEETLLEATFHLDPEVAQRRFVKAGFERTVTAIVVHRKQIGLRADDNLAYYNASRVALVLGLNRKTVTTWIVSGELPAKRRGTKRTEKQGGDQWWIKRRDLRCFIRDNAARIDLRKVDRLWFIDFAFGEQR